MELAPGMTGPRSATIRRSIDVRRVLRHGRRLSGVRSAAYVLPADGPTRVGFACSREVGGAVVRNRARRLMREAWRSLARRASEGHWVMMVARPEIVGSGALEVTEDLERVLMDGGVIR